MINFFQHLINRLCTGKSKTVNMKVAKDSLCEPLFWEIHNAGQSKIMFRIWVPTQRSAGDWLPLATVPRSILLLPQI